MAVTALSKGKEKKIRASASETHLAASSASASDSSLGSDSDSDSNSDSTSEDDYDSFSDEEITQEHLESLLEKARQNALSLSSRVQAHADPLIGEEDVIQLNDDAHDKQPPLPPLNPGELPAAYIEVDESRRAGPSKIRDLDVERAEKASASLAAPAAPPPPPELSKSGKPLTKKEKKAMKNKTAGPGWFDLPAPAEADLPRLYREVEAMRLRNQLDPKRFYRKDEGEGKGIKGLPKHFAIGTILPESTPFGTASAENLSRSSRKRTLVDELVDDAEAKSYAKKKFKDLQSVRGAKGRGTLAQRKALRKPKW